MYWAIPIIFICYDQLLLALFSILLIAMVENEL
jgi:hypothetical protein